MKTPKPIDRCRLLLVVGVYLTFKICVAQTNGNLSGKITDSKTGDPIPYSNVFLSNTLIGAAADESGNYHLKNIAPGKYDLTISSVGYLLTSKTITIELGENKQDMEVNPDIKTLNEIVVKSSPSDYRRHLKLFQKYFLGDTRNSLKCKIVNIDEIAFGYDAEKKILIAACDVPIVIDNKALGYRIFYFLKEFRLDSYLGYSTLAGIPKFEPLTPTNSAELAKWAKERERAYKGSVNHFMRSLKASKLSDNKFSIYLLSRKPFVKMTDTVNDTLYSIEPSNEVDLSKRDFNEKCFLKIIYNGEKQEIDYDRRRGANLLPQTSFLKFKKHGLIIFDNGYFEDPLSYHLGGYWAWSTKVAELLPLGYEPPTEKVDPMNFKVYPKKKKR